MELRQCPYDETPVAFERVGPDAVLVRCDHCGARWEWHNAYLRRIEDPDVEAVRQRQSERDILEPPTRPLRSHVRR